MNEQELNEAIEKFPSVLKKALQDKIVSFDTFDPQKKFAPKQLYRGLRCKPKDGNIELFDSDFLSQAELFYWIKKIEDAENEDVVKAEMPPDLLAQVDFFRSSNGRKNFKNDDMRLYSCSFSDSREKLESLFAKPSKGKYIAQGVVIDSQGIISDKNGNPWHVHCFFYDGINIKENFKVCK